MHVTKTFVMSRIIINLQRTQIPGEFKQPEAQKAGKRLGSLIVTQNGRVFVVQRTVVTLEKFLSFDPLQCPVTNQSIFQDALDDGHKTLRE